MEEPSPAGRPDGKLELLGVGSSISAWEQATMDCRFAQNSGRAATHVHVDDEPAPPNPPALPQAGSLKLGMNGGELAAGTG